MSRHLNRKPSSRVRNDGDNDGSLLSAFSFSSAASAAPFTPAAPIEMPSMPFPAHSSVATPQQRPAVLDLPSMYAAVDAGMSSQLFEPSAADLVSIPSIVAFLKSHSETQLLKGEYDGVREHSTFIHFTRNSRQLPCSLRITSNFIPMIAPPRPADESELAVSVWWEAHRWPSYKFEAMFKYDTMLIPVQGVFIPGQGKVKFSNPDKNILWNGSLQFYPHARGAAHVQLIGHLAEDPNSYMSQYRCNLYLNINALVHGKPVEGSPIQNQSVTTLAVMCRYLTLPELLHTYRSCKLLQQAACHPLTFQHNLRIGVDEWTGAFVRGPGGSFSLVKKFRDALTHRPFKGNFRILTLGSTVAASYELLREMTHPDAPCLRSLNLFTLADTKNLQQLISGAKPENDSYTSSYSLDDPTSSIRKRKSEAESLDSSLDLADGRRQEPQVPLTHFLGSRPVPMSDWPSMKFLRLLHLNILPCNVSLLRDCIPASLEILQLTFASTGQRKNPKRIDYFDDDLPTILRVNPNAKNIRQVVIRVQPNQGEHFFKWGEKLLDDDASSLKAEGSHRLAFTTDDDLTMLQQLVTIEHLEQIHWLIPIDCSQLVNGYNVAPIPRIPKIRALLMSNFNFSEAIPILSLFPALARLDISEFVMLDDSYLNNPAWPSALVAGMEEIIVHSASRKAPKPLLQNNNQPPAASSRHRQPPGGLAADSGSDILKNVAKSPVALIDPYQYVLNTLASAGNWPNLAGLVIIQNSEPTKRLQLEDTFRSMPSLTDLTLTNIVVNQPRCFVLLKNLKTLRDFTWPYVAPHMEEFRASDFPSLSYLHVSHMAPSQTGPDVPVAPPSKTPNHGRGHAGRVIYRNEMRKAMAPQQTESITHSSLSTYLHLLKQIDSLKTVKWRRSKALNPHTAVIDLKLEQERLERVAAMSAVSGMTESMKEQITKMENQMHMNYEFSASSVPAPSVSKYDDPDATSNRLRLEAGMQPIPKGPDPAVSALLSATKHNNQKPHPQKAAGGAKSSKKPDDPTPKALFFAPFGKKEPQEVEKQPPSEPSPVAASAAAMTEEIEGAAAALNEDDLADILLAFSLSSEKQSE